MKESTRFLINKHARKDVAGRVTHFARSMGIEPMELGDQSLNLSDSVSSVVAVGGDGTAQAVIKEAVRANRSVDVFIAAGGTENGLYRNLKRHKQIATVEDVRHGKKFKDFKPGIVNGTVFQHILNLGDTEHKIASLAANLRGSVPRDSRIAISTIVGLTEALIRKRNSDTFLQFVLTGGHMGRYNVLPSHSMFSENLAVVSIPEDDSRRLMQKLLLFSLYTIMGVNPPSSVVKVEYTPSFVAEKKGGFKRVNLDGEPGIMYAEQLRIERSKKGISVAALVFEK